MQRPAHVGQLREHEWQRLNDIVDRFEHAWQTQGVAGINVFAPPADDPLHVAVLTELVKTDLHQRWSRGTKTLLDDYLKAYPQQLGDARTVDVDVVYEEYRARHLYGDQPDLATYRQRFPDQFARLEERVRQEPVRAIAPPGSQAGRPSLTSRFATLVAGGNSPTPTDKLPSPPTQQAANDDGNNVLPSGDGYRLEERIGTGSFAEVYRGRSPGGYPVAIKRVFRPVDHESGQRELQALQQTRELQHPFLLQTHLYFLQGDRLYVVMELAERTLRDRLVECQKQGLMGIPVPELLRYFHESAEALDYMHSRHVLHRDIKPQNILLLGKHAKVADFGLARMLQEERLLVSASGSGTPAYMAPEVFRGKVGERSDQYSLAMTYVETRIGRWPFSGTDIMAIMMDRLQSDSELDLGEMSEPEKAVLNRALAGEPANRYPSCGAFVEALEAALVSSGLLTASVLTSSGEHPPVGGAIGGSTIIQTTPGSGRDTSVLPPPVPPEPPPPGFPGWLRAVLLLLVLIAGGVGAVFLAPLLRKSAGNGEGMPAAFTFDDPEPLSVAAGTQQNLRIGVSRHHFSEAIPLTFEDLPAGVRIVGEGGNPDSPLVIPANRRTVDLQVRVAPDTLPMGDKPFKVHGMAGEEMAEATFQLTIRPVAGLLGNSAVVWRPAPDTLLVPVGNRLLYRAIDVVKGSAPVRFQLLTRGPRNALPREIDAFYIMENMVWVELFRQYASAAGDDKLASSLWKSITATGQKDPVNRMPLRPVMGVHVDDAHGFARWLIPEGGQLPLPVCWDKAAGRFEPDRGEGPFTGTFAEVMAKPGQVAVGLDEPVDHGTAPLDRVPFSGCRDMAGNGLEWTSEVRDLNEFAPGANLRVPIARPTDAHMVLIRSRSYNARDPGGPLRYADLEDTPLYYEYLKPRADVGFRVMFVP